LSNKEEIIEEARQRGREYLPIYRGCAPATFCAVVDTLQMPVSPEMFKMMSGLSSVSGGCGGICGAAASIGLRFGQSRNIFEDPSNRPAEGSLSSQIIQTMKRVRDRFTETYGGFLCAEIQTALFGQAFNPTIPEEYEVFGREDVYGTCPSVTANAAGWVVETILEAEATSS
jgi:hypothetical protein